ncbi:MAG: sigma-70 family RNA polymerase sigma factor [Planctomycetota bacterium]|nr:sigma-70 family RNA polymerase sigma factor [Planctomycetota bacterium]
MEATSTDPLEASLGGSVLPDPTESLRLLDEAQNGDRRALEDLLARYQDRIRRIVHIRLSVNLRTRIESMDIVQETLSAAFQHINDLQPRSTASILQWLSRIAENRIRDAWRSHFAEKRDPRREVDIEALVSSGGGPDSPTKSPSEKASQRELEAVVDEAMAQLSEDAREVILLRTYQGGSWDFVAHQLGRPGPDAARQLYRRARVQLGRLVRRRLQFEADQQD